MVMYNPFNNFNNIEIGLELLVLSTFPPLCKGKTLASFHTDGKTPSDKEKLIKQGKL